MFHLKFITKDLHPTFTEVEKLITDYKKRRFFIFAKEHGFTKIEIEQLLQQKCGLCIQHTDNLSKGQIKKYIDVGGKSVTLLPKSYSEADVLDHLDSGASVLIKKGDGFDPFQVTKIVQKGKSRVTVVGSGFDLDDMESYLKKGGAAIFKKGDFDDLDIQDLLAHTNGRTNIHADGFNSSRIDKYIMAKSKVTFGKNCSLGKVAIENRVKKHKKKIHILSSDYDDAWVTKVETLGATIL